MPLSAVHKHFYGNSFANVTFMSDCAEKQRAQDTQVLKAQEHLQKQRPTIATTAKADMPAYQEANAFMMPISSVRQLIKTLHEKHL